MVLSTYVNVLPVSVPGRPCRTPRTTEEKVLIKKRGRIKRRITAFANHLSTLDASSLSASDARELQLRNGKFESLYDQYDEVQLKIEVNSDNSELQIGERI